MFVIARHYIFAGMHINHKTSTTEKLKGSAEFLNLALPS